MGEIWFIVGVEYTGRMLWLAEIRLAIPPAVIGAVGIAGELPLAWALAVDFR
jgi:hypothetical protein